MFYPQSEDYRPLFWFQGRPIYVTTALVIFHIVYFIVIALWIAFSSVSAVFQNIALIPEAIWQQGEVWRFFTYFAVDPAFFSDHFPSFLIYMVILYLAGKEIEQFIGRSAFLKFYCALLLVPALLFSVLGLILANVSGSSADFHGYLGYFEIIFGVGIGVATLYPNVCLWERLPLSNFILAWAFLALDSLVDIAFHNTVGLIMLWLCTATAYASIRLFGAGRGLEWLIDWWEDRRLARLARQHKIQLVQKQQKENTIDEILEKISQTGMASLTAQERAVLERTRAELIKRDGR